MIHSDAMGVGHDSLNIQTLGGNTWAQQTTVDKVALIPHNNGYKFQSCSFYENRYRTSLANPASRNSKFREKLRM